MRKIDELTHSGSCMSRARDEEMTFVLLGRDAAAPAAIRAWVAERIRLGKNAAADDQITEALDCARTMDLERAPAAPSPSPPPVDRSQRTLTDGSPVTPDHRELKANGQQKGYVVLSAEERAKGFVRPVRRTYTHKTCGTDTTMASALAETYARDPEFYSGTFCTSCGKHFPLDQFVWTGTDERVGS